MALIRRQKKDAGLQRRERTAPKPQEYKEFPRGGHVPDAPVHCQWRKKFENGGKFWTETYFCGFVCRDVGCVAYKNYQRNLREESRRNR
jgi:hypothetical protein